MKLQLASEFSKVSGYNSNNTESIFLFMLTANNWNIKLIKSIYNTIKT